MDQTNERPDEGPAAVKGVEPLEPLSTRTSPTRQRMRRRTGSGERQLDEQIRQLVESAGVAHTDLLEQSVGTLFRAGRTANRGEMKLLQRSLRELVRAFRIFAPYRGRRKVSIFGSARTATGDPNYEIAREFGEQIVAEGWMVITGAGPGIMAAGHEGAGSANSFGVGIKLPFEQAANGFIAGDPKLIDFKYFFTRKIMFMKESDAFVLLPGGFGTLDEAFELLTLMQTGKTQIRPIVLLAPRESGYWLEWLTFVRDHLVARNLASPEDLALFEPASSAADAVRAIARFYRNYDSARYVGERLVLRMYRVPDDDALAAINRDFGDLVARGRIERITVTKEERADEDCVYCERLAFYPRHNFGRLRQLIDRLNEE